MTALKYNYCKRCDKLLNNEDRKHPQFPHMNGLCQFCICDLLHRDVKNPIAYTRGYHGGKNIWKKGTKSYKAYMQGVQEDSNWEENRRW